jgi:hypothetical protein
MKFKSILLSGVLFPTLAFAFTFDRNVPKHIQTQMQADLRFIESIKGNTQSDLHKQIFGAVSGEDYSRFFNSRISSIGIHKCGGTGFLACVIPAKNPSKMWLTESYDKISLPQTARLMFVFHEARHTETEHGNWGHALCPQPYNDPDGRPINSVFTKSSLAGQPGCDITAYGSYGSSLIMMKNISKFCTNCGEKVKMDAGIFADDQLYRIVNSKARKDIEADLYRS